MRELPKGHEEVIESPQEIAEILNLAKDYLWKFSFHKPGEQADPDRSTEIFHVNPDEGYVTVSSELNNLCPDDNDPVQFFAENGGISVHYKSRTLPYPGNPLAYRFASERRVAFPDKLTYRQNRTDHRFSFEGAQPVPLALYTDDGIHLTGVVSDMSASGMKVKFPGYVIEPFEEKQVTADCVIELPNGQSLQCGIEVLGQSYEFTSDASYIRGKFQELTNENKSQIKELIQLISELRVKEKQPA